MEINKQTYNQQKQECIDKKNYRLNVFISNGTKIMSEDTESVKYCINYELTTANVTG